MEMKISNPYPRRTDFFLELPQYSQIETIDLQSSIAPIVASEHQYGEWLKQHRVQIKENQNLLEEAQLDKGEAL
jgi:hypothetical protein